MDINNFDRKVRRQISRMLSDKGNVSSESLRKLLDAINPVLTEKIKMTQLTKTIENLSEYYDIVKGLFDIDDGFISKITFDGKFPNQLRMSKSVWKTPSEFARIASRQEL